MTAYLNFHVIAALLNATRLGEMLFFAVVVTPVVIKSLAGPTHGLFRFNFSGILPQLDLVLRPQIDQNRAGDYAGEAVANGEFKCLHRASVLINLLQMIASSIIFFRLAA